MTAPIDYNAVLADLQARRVQLDAAINVIQALLGSGGTAPPSEEVGGLTGASVSSVVIGSGAPPVRENGTTALRNDAFFGLSTSAAMKKFLAMVKRPMSPRAIAQALFEGGQIHAVDERTAYVNVYSVLKRGRDKDFNQTRSGEWGLVEWYSSKQRSDNE
jgi:hypothetical protein